MSQRRQDAIRDALRGRVLRALDAGTLRGGDRLPSTRELAAEMEADPRVVAAAYRQLAAEGLVELRARAGVFVADPTGEGPPRDAPRGWVADVVAQGVLRGVPASRLAERLRAAVATREVRAAVVATTVDQAEGIAREVRDDLGMACTVVLADALPFGEPAPRAMRRAHVIITTEAHERRLRPLAERLARRLVVIRVRPDLVSREYRAVLRRVTWVVVADARFGAMVRTYLAGSPGAEHVRIVVAGRDDLSQIPGSATTYVTQAARARIGRTRLPGRVLPPARTLADDCIHELARVLVEENLGASRDARRVRS